MFDLYTSLQFDDRLATIFSKDQISIGFWQLSYTFEHDINSLDFEFDHLHESIKLLLVAFSEIKNSFHLNSFRNNIFVINNATFTFPSIVSGSGSAQDNLRINSQ